MYKFLSVQIQMPFPKCEMEHTRQEQFCSIISIMTSLETTNAPKAFRFLDLPAEIRNMVFDMVLPERVQTIGPAPTYSQDNRNLALLRTSRQVRHESYAIYHQPRSLHIELTHMVCYTDFIKWVKGIKDRYVLGLRTLEVRGWVEAYRGARGIIFKDYTFEIDFAPGIPTYTLEYSLTHGITPWLLEKARYWHADNIIDLVAQLQILLNQPAQRRKAGCFAVTDIEAIVETIASHTDIFSTEASMNLIRSGRNVYLRGRKVIVDLGGRL